MKILVADDDRVFRGILKGMLERWGHEAVVAADGAEAWELLRARDGPRIAVLDWVMPELDGIELCRRARTESLEHYVYIILLTARANSADLLSGLEAGADDYITKPASLEELRLRIGTACRIAELGSSQRTSEFHVMQLRRRYAELFRSEDQERSQVARELHEGVAQAISGMAMSLASMRISGLESAIRSKALDDLIATAQSCVRDIQALSYRIYPALLVEIGLVTALRAFVERSSQSDDIALELDAPVDFERLNYDLEVCVYRVIQKGVTNLRRECGCSRAVIRLERRPSELLVEILGSGGKAARSPETPLDLGPEIRERIEQYGGTLGVAVNPGGATISVALPQR